MHGGEFVSDRRYGVESVDKVSTLYKLGENGKVWARKKIKSEQGYAT